MSHDTIPSRLFRSARLRPEAPALFTKKGSEWVCLTYREYAHVVRRVTRALIALGFEAGQTACILGFNRAEWAIFDVAVMTAGGAPAGIYTTCSKEEVQYIIDHSGAPIVLVENQMQWEKVKAERHRMPKLRHVVTMEGAPTIDDPMVLSWAELLAKGDLVKDAEVDKRLAALEPANLATLIYTSGTTGPPKGVMLSHRNLSWTADTASRLVNGGPWDRSISYLPLSHIAEQVFTIHGPLTMGGSVYFAESIDKLMENIKDVRPTIFFGVPRIWEKMHSGIAGKLGEAKGVKKELAAWARGVGTAVNELRHHGEEPTGALLVQYRLAKRLVFTKLRDALGLGSARVCVSGAAPIAREVIEFFGSLDIPIYEVYGQSEDTGPTSFNLPGKTRLGTVGPILPGLDVKIAADGEILVKGPNVFLGYFKEPQATAEALIDGWLYSGDLGTIDRDGYLHITGRKKEIIITAGGKNIAPKNIEAALKNHPLIAEAVVIGDRRKYLTALVTLDPDAAKRFLDERGMTCLAHEAREVQDEIQRALDEINRTLARVETVKKFHILPRPFTIEHGELTPTLKVKRKIVYEHFADTIESMYRGRRSVTPLVIGIAGGTGSGKTTVARRIAEALPRASVTTIEHDSYYCDRHDLSPAERDLLNFDHPDALETSLLVEQVRALKSGSPIDVPIYDFATHRRRPDARRVSPTPVVIVEGILTFVEPALRELLDMKIFVDTDADVRVLRRIRRDIEQRGRTFDSVREQYYRTVRPMHLQFVEPSKRWADLILPESGNIAIAVDVVVAKLLRTIHAGGATPRP